MQVGSSFTVGAYQIDRQAVNPALVRQMANSAGNINVENNVSQAAWTELADRVEQQDAISADDLKQIGTLGRACFKHHRELHNSLRESGYKNQTIQAELQDVHVFRAGSDKINSSVALAQAKLAVEAAAGAGFGPTNLVSTYVAFSDMQKKALEPVMEQIQGFRDGTNPSLYQGNKAEGFHGEQIWKQMNTMLDDAIASGKSGKPVEVDAQYYELTSPEIVGKLSLAAQAGDKVRVNVDPGRLVAFQGDHVVIDEVPDKLRAIIQLADTKGDVGVSMYPITKQLGSANNLMHRKGLRVGDQFLLSGMNANAGSGENIDAGYVLEGPAAKRLVENFSRDVSNSAGASASEVYGDKPLAGFMEGDINMGQRGLISLFDCITGPSPAGSELPKATTGAELRSIADSMGMNLADFTDCTPEEMDRLVGSGGKLPLNAKGKEQFLEVVDRTIAKCNSKKNLSRLKDIKAPEGKPVGDVAVALADVPAEREALMITTLQEAEEFIYIPAFVMTKSIASVIVARRDELRAQGKELDIRVIADSGVYPDGGTPNQGGVAYLEDAGVNVHWTLLTRSGSHDRKIHAKEILTDKGEFYGSTNFSKKGMRDNWEHSGYVKFDEKSAESIEQREAAKEKFLQLWEHESIGINTATLASKRKASHKKDKDYEVQVQEARAGVVRDTIRQIGDFEKASAKFVAAQVQQDPAVAARVDELTLQGYDDGNATMMAVKEKMGDEAFYAALDKLPERQALDRIK